MGFEPTRQFASGVLGAAPADRTAWLRAAKTAIAGGQYDYPQGLFWGGNRWRRAEKLIKVLPGLLDSVQDILWIDVHSRLGVWW